MRQLVLDLRKPFFEPAKPPFDSVHLPGGERKKDQRKQGKTSHQGQPAHDFMRHRQPDTRLARMSREGRIDHGVLPHHEDERPYKGSLRHTVPVPTGFVEGLEADLTDTNLPDYCPLVSDRGSAQTHVDRPFAVVTGASRGIGAAYARALASRGYDLLLVARDREALEHVGGELRASAVSVRCECIDLSEPEAAHRLYAAARQCRSVPDLLVNNAGFGLCGEFVSMPMARIQQMLRLHVNTVVESVRLFLPGMVERKAGSIVNVASVAGFFAVPYLAEYAATKAFLIHFSQALDEEVRQSGVRVQVCCPGSTDTEFHRTAGFRPRNPFGVQRPEHVVRASLSALKQGPALVTVGVSGALLAMVSRCAPRRLVSRGAGRWMKRSVVSDD